MRSYAGSFSHLERRLSQRRRAGKAEPVEATTTNDMPVVSFAPIVPPIAASILCLCIKQRERLNRQEAATEGRLAGLRNHAPAYANPRKESLIDIGFQFRMKGTS